VTAPHTVSRVYLMQFLLHLVLYCTSPLYPREAVHTASALGRRRCPRLMARFFLTRGSTTKVHVYLAAVFVAAFGYAGGSTDSNRRTDCVRSMSASQTEKSQRAVRSPSVPRAPTCEASGRFGIFDLFFLWLRRDCRIESAIIRLLNINTVPAHTCLPTFGSQGSQATLPDDCVARVTG
jgi:hypothetical protein